MRALHSIPILAAALALCAPRPCAAQSPAAQAPATQATTGQAAPTQAPADPVQGPPQEDPRTIVLGSINERPMTLADAMATFTSSHTGHGVLVRGEKAVRELIGRLAERELFLAEAETLGLPKDPLVDSSVENYRRALVTDLFWTRAIKEKLKVADEDVEAFYGKTDVALKVTLIQTRERGDCERLLKSVQAGADMGDLAGKESTHASRSFGGQLPYVRRGDLDPDLEKLLFALEQPKSLTSIVAVAGGFAFARMDERTVNQDRLPREVALPQIRKILLDRLEDTLRAETEERLEKEGGFVFDEALLAPERVLGSGDDEAVVARSIGKTLTMAQLRDALEIDALRRAGAETVKGAIHHVALDWAQREVIWKEAPASGLYDDPEIARQAESYRKEMILSLLCQRYVWPQKDPSEDELRAYYAKNVAAGFTRPAERHLAYIVLETKEQAEQMLERIRAGENFEKLARENSKDKRSAVHGGRIGWIKQGEIIPEVEPRAFALADGQMDGPIESPQGWFIVRSLEHKDPQVIPFEEARAAALKRLVKERQQSSYDQWARDLRERATLQYDEAGIQRAVAWLERQPKSDSKPPEAGSAHPRPPLPEPIIPKKGH